MKDLNELNTEIELIKQKNRERHKLALSQFFKPRDNKFKGYKHD